VDVYSIPRRDLTSVGREEKGKVALRYIVPGKMHTALKTGWMQWSPIALPCCAFVNGFYTRDGRSRANM
jgi:hypothetical protein